MIIFLLGYMGSGKSTVGKLLSQTINSVFIDLDQYIEQREKSSISDIFKNNGEIYFRKIENRYLKELITIHKHKKTVISLGGGTPCYAGNIDLIKEATDLSFYLSLPYKSLTNRLWTEKDSRPLIAALGTKEILEDYVRKHLFERGYYYNQANFKIATEDLTREEVTEHIISKLF